MKRFSKKILSLLLCAVLAVSVFAAAGTSGAAEVTEQIPIIYIMGMSSIIYAPNEDGSIKRVDDVLNTDSVVKFLTDNKDLFLSSIATQDWSDFCDAVIDFLTETFKDLALGPDGLPHNGSYSGFRFDDDIVRERMNSNAGIERFYYEYDWRLDPLDNMDRLHEFVETVLRVTGSSEYAMCGRCEGACLALAYYETFKDERMTGLSFLASAAKGADPVGEAFSGNLYIDADALERMAYESDLGLNYEITEGFTFTDETLDRLLKIASDVYGLDLVCWAVNNVYDQIAERITPESLRASYGSFPGMWAMCEDEYYEPAKKLVFGGVEDEYSGLIEKIDYYHYNIMNRAEEILLDASENGVRITNITKYGRQAYPVSHQSSEPSDNICRVGNASFGATVVDVGETFDDDYLRDAFKRGEACYISPDICIDASTCLFPDTTWFVKNLAHGNFPVEANSFIEYIISTPGLTVKSDPACPQYMFFNEEIREVVRYDAEELKNRMDIINEEFNTSFMRKLKRLFLPVFKAVTFVTKLLVPRARV